MRILARLLWGGVAGQLLAVCAAGTAPPGVAKRLFAEPVEISERGLVTSYAWLTQSNKFNFIPPMEWSTKPDEAVDGLTLLSRELNMGITIRFIETNLVAGEAYPTNYWIERVIERWPDAEIRAESRAYSPMGQGRGFDLQRRVQGATMAAMRMVFIPHDRGVVEFQLTSPPSQFERGSKVLRQLLSSFRVEPWPRPPGYRPGGPPPLPAGVEEIVDKNEAGEAIVND